MSEPRAFVRAAVELLDGLSAGDAVRFEGLSREEYAWVDLQRTERRPNVMLAYHDGKLGFRGNQFGHENRCGRATSLVLAVAAACSVNLVGTGRATFRREDRRACVEADASYYLPHREFAQRFQEVALNIHPPPDLAVEVEEPPSPLSKLPTHAALGVPEVWVIDRAGATSHRLGSDGGYEPRPVSRSLPMVKSADVSRFIPADWPDDSSFCDAVYRRAETLPSQP